jgi:predicted Ser/Thr protein kinase
MYSQALVDKVIGTTVNGWTVYEFIKRGAGGYVFLAGSDAVIKFHENLYGCERRIYEDLCRHNLAPKRYDYGNYYTVYERMDGDLSSYKFDGIDDLHRVVLAIKELTDTLRTELGMCHGDLKVENVLFKGKTIRLCDFDDCVEVTDTLLELQEKCFERLIDRLLVMYKEQYREWYVIHNGL